MCWESYEVPVKRIAENDISVFKIVTSSLLSYYHDFKYTEGQTYTMGPLKVEKNVFGEEIFTVDEGFHSYSSECTYYCNKANSLITISPEKVILDAFPHPHLAKLNCVIPAGAEYYVNDNGVCVSNQIKVINAEDIRIY